MAENHSAFFIYSNAMNIIQCKRIQCEYTIKAILKATAHRGHTKGIISTRHKTKQRDVHAKNFKYLQFRIIMLSRMTPERYGSPSTLLVT